MKWTYRTALSRAQYSQVSAKNILGGLPSENEENDRSDQSDDENDHGDICQ